MWNGIMWIMFLILLLAPLMLFGVYLWHNSNQNYNIKKTLADIRSSSKGNIHERFILIAKSGLNRTNGWNLLSALYAGMYYCFNLWGFLFAVFSLICAADIYKSKSAVLLTAICAGITSITMCCQLFLRSDRKWRAFARKHHKACMITNRFLHRVGKSKNPELTIVVYANKIMKLEDSIKDEDLL